MGTGTLRTTQILIQLLMALAALPAAGNSPGMSVDALVSSQMPTPAMISEPPRGADGRRYPRLWFGSIRWEQPEKIVQFDVDSNLAPVATFNYNFQIIVQLRSPDDESKDLPDGIYLLRMVILKPNSSSSGESLNLYSRYLAGSERLVRLEHGTVRTPMSFRFHSISATSMRNTLLMQVLPVKPESIIRTARGLITNDSPYELQARPNYLANVIRIPFIPRVASDLKTPMPPTLESDASEEESLDLGLFIRQSEEIIRLNKHAMARQLRKSPETLAKDLKVEFVNTSTYDLDQAKQSSPFRHKASASLRAVAKAIETIGRDQEGYPEDLVTPICLMLNRQLTIDPMYLPYSGNKQFIDTSVRNQMLHGCVAFPERYFSLSKQVHIHKFDRTKTRQLQGESIRLSMISNFGTNRTNSNDIYSAWAQGFNPIFSPIDLKGILRFGYTYTVNETRSRSRFEGSLLSNAIDLEVQTWRMQLEVNESTSCILVKPIQDQNGWKFAKTIPGLYICNPRENNQRNQIVESFFHIFPQAASSTTIDLLDPMNQPVNMVLRGQRDYIAFLTAAQKHLKPYHEANTHVGTDLRSSAQVNKLGLPAIPEIFGHPIRITGQKSDLRLAQKNEPTFWDRMFHRVDDRIQ